MTWQEGTTSSARPSPGNGSTEPRRAGVCQPLTCAGASPPQDVRHTVRPGRPCPGCRRHPTAQEGLSGRDGARTGPGPRFWVATAHWAYPSHVPLVRGRRHRRTLWRAHGLCLTPLSKETVSGLGTHGSGSLGLGPRVPVLGLPLCGLRQVAEALWASRLSARRRRSDWIMYVGLFLQDVKSCLDALSLCK